MLGDSPSQKSPSRDDAWIQAQGIVRVVRGILAGWLSADPPLLQWGESETLRELIALSCKLPTGGPSDDGCRWLISDCYDALGYADFTRSMFRETLERPIGKRWYSVGKCPA